MYRYYYVTLCGEYRGNYVNVFAKNKEEAYSLAVKKYGILNVSTAYMEKAFMLSCVRNFKCLGEVFNPEKDEYLRRKRII